MMTLCVVWVFLLHVMLVTSLQPKICIQQANLAFLMACARRDIWWHWKAGFWFSEKPRCPLINIVGDDISTPMKQPLGCAPWNLFGDGTSTLVYKQLDLNVWPKSRNGKKIRHLGIFKLSILQENKWEVGRILEATLLTPSNILPSGCGWIYHLLSEPPRSPKQYEVIINDYLAYSCIFFSPMMTLMRASRGHGCHVKHLYYILQYAMYSRIKKPIIHYPSWSWNEVHRLLNCAKVLEVN